MRTRTSGRDDIKRVLLRLPAAVHTALADKARQAGLSFNEACVGWLTDAATGTAGRSKGADVAERAQTLFGNDFLGLIAIGSVVRGDAAPESDLDLLVVLDTNVQLSRALYRDWDAAGDLHINGRLVDVHFIVLPSEDVLPSAAWAEAAITGDVWVDRDGRVAAHLARTREAIAHGHIVRRSLHGQVYWKDVA